MVALLNFIGVLAVGQLHADIKTAHLIWMNHLDVGFTNTISSVMNDYIHLYFPKAITTAAAVNTPGEPPIFKYTSHAYLLDMFLNCPTQMGLNCSTDASLSLPVSMDTFGALRDEEEYGLGLTPSNHPNCIICPNASLVADVIAAVEAGVITWHAYPHNAELELTDASLFQEGLASVRRLDARFKSPAARKQKIVASQRDVPGLTRGAVPLLAAAGVKAFSVGCNAQITPPEVPNTIFNWVDEASNTSVLVMLHPRGYGVMLEDGTGTGTGVPLFSSGEPSEPRTDKCKNLQGHGDWSVHDVVTVPGFDEALVYVFKSDNKGPPSTDEVHSAVNCTAALFPPTAQLAGSTFDAFVDNLLASGLEKSLPTLTSEIGDTWIYGAASDPRRQKLARMMMRTRAACVAEGGACDASDIAIANFSRFVLKVPSHIHITCCSLSFCLFSLFYFFSVLPFVAGHRAHVWTARFVGPNALGEPRSRARHQQHELHGRGAATALGDQLGGAARVPRLRKSGAVGAEPRGHRDERGVRKSAGRRGCTRRFRGPADGEDAAREGGREAAHEGLRARRQRGDGRSLLSRACREWRGARRPGWCGVFFRRRQ